MSFLDAFEDVFTEPDNVLTIDPATAEKDSLRTDFFDREDEPVIW